MFEYQLPDVGEGVAEGEIVAWLVEPGDHVEEDEVLAEIETDKAVVDLPSPVAGTIRELHAEEGDVFPVGEVIVTIDPDGDAEDGDAEETATKQAIEPAGNGESADADSEGSGTETAVADKRVFAPPNVRRLARELGVDIATVEGSGPGGRVTEGDVRSAAEDDVAEEATAAVSKADDTDEEVTSAVSKVDDETEPTQKSATRRVDGQTGERADRERTLAAPATRRLAREEGVDIDAVPTEKTRDGEAFVEPEDVRAFLATREAETADGASAETAEATTAATTEGDRAERREPYRGIRRTIGNAMATSKYTAPHVSHHDTAVVDELVATRTRLKERASGRDVNLTYLPFVMKAVVAALQEYPVLNTTLEEESEEVVYKQYYNIGVAVATEAGLMVPVVEDVDEKGLVELARETADLAERARSRDLSREEMQGGTFTITNFGAIGGEYATPIINHPETAILGLGAIEQRPVVEDGEVCPAHTLPLSLSIDHRVIDGAEGAGFVNAVIEYLEDPALLLLE